MMSLFQCENCGCVENTALALQGTKGVEELFDWTRIEERRGMMLCRACAPTHYAQGVLTGMGSWHNQFKRIYLPMGMFKTARNGNLEHIETGEQDYKKYAIA